MIRRLIILLLIVGCMYADILNVPYDYATIQEAIDAANEGDTVLVAEGTYSPSTNGESFPIEMISNVNLFGQGAEVTIVDAENTDRVFIMENCFGNTISGISIIGGNTQGAGGGMHIVASNPKLNEIIIEGNTSFSEGGGINLSFSEPIIKDVVIRENTSNSGGGISIWASSNPMLTNVIITDNISEWNAGGVYIISSNPTLANVLISGNMANNSHGGIYLSYSNAILTNVTISRNIATNNCGGICLSSYSNPTLTNLTIVENIGGTNQGAFFIGFACNPIIMNSIIWGNNPQSIYLHGYGNPTPIIQYSNVDGGWEGIGNIDTNPMFIDINNGDYNLQIDSPCIDAGDPNPWYADIDGSRADMGSTGNSKILPNFKEYYFGEVGAIPNMKNWFLYNYRETPITIDSVSFSTITFTANIQFPIIINPFTMSIIPINCEPEYLGLIEDNMVLHSPNLEEGLLVSLSVIGSEGNLISGDLSGILPSATFHIMGDINIQNGDQLTLLPGTKLLFDDAYSLNIEGILLAQGTAEDSIIFNKYGDGRWKGIIFNNVTNETIFDYVHISRASYEGAMSLYSSNPKLSNMTIIDNYGNGVYLRFSDPDLKNMTIASNSSSEGGGMYLYSSNPSLSNITIKDNWGEFGGGMYLYLSNPSLNNVIINNNLSPEEGAGMYLWLSNPSLTNVKIISNISVFLYGAGMYLAYSNPTLNHVTISKNFGSLFGEAIFLYNSNPNIKNSIIWGNGSTLSGSGIADINYSDIQGGWEGEGNIDVDPLFTDPENDNYTLQSDSPCIDTGIPIEDMEYCDDAPDMGAYEYCVEECGAELGDVNGNGEINILDLVQISYYILEVSIPNFVCAADFNQDGQVNILDLVQIANYILEN